MITGLVVAVFDAPPAVAASPAAPKASSATTARPAVAAAQNPGVSPIAQRTSSQVTADALPTVQVDGIVWAQAVVGTGANGTVYAGGKFAKARPAGAAAGSNTSPRGNLLAYNIGTGNLVTSFAPTLNAQVLAVAASPDGTKVYVGGDFTTANGVTHNRLAAYSTATGQLLSSFVPNLDAKVKTIVATNTTVYVSGIFSKANGSTRTRLAAFNGTTGALLNWAPTADDNVNAMVLTPDGSRLVIGGAFQNVNGSAAYGLAEVDATTGATVAWPVNQTVRDAGANSAIESLSTDGTSIFGTGYVYGAGGNLEGAFSADPNSGAINWIEDCHGDTYSNYPMNGTLYTVSHAHYCANIGGYFQTTPFQGNMRHALAFTTAATGTVTSNYLANYYNWVGYSSPSLVNWFPDMTIGSISGQSQAAWSITGNGTYVVLGGEFPTVNGIGQQGLVRFAVKGVAPSAQGARITGTAAAPSLLSTTPGTVRVAFPANWDRDDKTLTYKVLRDGNSTPVYTVTSDSEFWNRPALGFTDTGLSPGSSHNYRIVESDADGNTYSSSLATITVAGVSPFSAYAKDVIAAGATHYWRLNEASGTKVYDYAGYDDAGAVTAISRGATGPIAGDGSAASTFDGSASLVVNQTQAPAPNTFSIGAWFNTTSTSGGKIVGYGNENAGASQQYDRHVYLDASGYLHFGVGNNGTRYTVDSTVKYNDGAWHQVVATFGANGLAMYVDGRLVGVNQNTTVASVYPGFWRIGGDTSWSGNSYFKGSIAEVAIYPTAISGVAVRQQYQDSGRTFTGISGPADAFGQVVYQDNPALYYRMDDTSGTSATDSSGNGAAGTYRGGIALGAPSTVSGTVGSAVTLNGAAGTTISSPTSTAAPKTYSQELWFKTTSTSGGELMDFGSSASGNSSTYDRVLSMANNGQVSYLVRPTSTTTATITSTGAYNDGQWHHVVATMGPDGSKLYLDGALTGSNPNVNALSYNGFWRIGGDASVGGISTYFAGSIDEAAVYNYPLTAAQVTAHRNASPSLNHVPTAAFTSTVDKLAASFDGSSSADSDGTIASYSWNFGDGSPMVTAATPTTTHTYVAAGTYSVTLTVTDNSGGTGTLTQSVTVVANVPPTASFTATATNLAVAFNGSASADPDGTISSYAWNFGDNSAVVTTGTPTTSHTYAAAGTYTATLTVTDNNGATGTATQSVSITAIANPTVATDSFNRTLTNAWGSADVGGAWTLSGSSSLFNVGSGTGTIKIATAGSGPSAYLNGVSALNINGAVDIALSAVPTTGSYASLAGRVNGTTYYRAQVAFTASSTTISVSKVVSGTETFLQRATIAGLTYNAGDVVRLRLQIVGSGGASTVSARAWKTTNAEPTAWQVSGTDTTAALQTAGGIGLRTYLTGSATAPVTISLRNLTTTRIASE